MRARFSWSTIKVASPARSGEATGVISPPCFFECPADHHRPAARALTGAIERLLSHATLILQDADVVAAALTQYRCRPALGFSDCLVVEAARKAGHLPLGTFDRRLGKLQEAQHLA